MKLNKIERLKTKLKPINYNLNRVDFCNLSNEDRFYLKNFGIYNIDINPKYFMLRVRIDGGIISKDMLIIIKDIAKKFNLKVIITARAQLELHYATCKNIFTIYSILKSKGFSFSQTLTDNFRALITEPLTNLTPHTKIDTIKIIKTITSEILDNSEFFGILPRKFNSAIIGTTFVSFNPWASDFLLLLSKKDGEYGFNLYLGGKSSEVAKDIDIFIPHQDAKVLFIAVARIYIEYGFRGSRSKTRLYFLVKELGAKKIKELLESRLNKKLKSAGELCCKITTETKSYFNIESFGEFGELNLDTLNKAILLNAKIYRLTPNQELLAINKSKKQDIFKSSNITACAGEKYCKLSLWSIKEDIDSNLANILKKEAITLGFSGCLKGCGRNYMSDIGLIGLRTNLYGKTQKAARVYIGGIRNFNPSPARLLYYSVPKKHLNSLLLSIIELYKESKESSFETFSQKILNYYDVELLQLFFLANLQYRLSAKCKLYFFLKDIGNLQSKLKKLDTLFTKDISEATKILSHKVWDD